MYKAVKINYIPNIGILIYFVSFRAFMIINFETPLSCPHMVVISDRNLLKSIAPITDISNKPKSLLAECSWAEFLHNPTRRSASSLFRLFWQLFTKCNKTGI